MCENTKRDRKFDWKLWGKASAMIISKDLFLLGEQDYLRLPKDEKRGRKNTAQKPPVVMGKTPPDESR